MPEEVDSYLTPDPEGASTNLLSIVVPEGLSPYAITVFKLGELKKRLDENEQELVTLDKIRKTAENEIEVAFNKMIDAHDAYKKAYEKHESAIRGDNLDAQKADAPSALLLQHTATVLTEAQQKHKDLSSQWKISFEMNVDMRMNLLRNRWRIQRAVAFLERKLPTLPPAGKVV